MDGSMKYIEEHGVDIRQVFWKLLLRWKQILAVACIFAVLGYGYAKYKNAVQAESQTTEASEDQDELLDSVDYEKVGEEANEVLHRYETGLKNEYKYMMGSLLLQMDPYNMISVAQEFEIRAEGDVDVNQLAAVGKMLTNYAASMEIMSIIADKYDTEPQYIREIVGGGSRDNQYGLDEVNIHTEAPETEFAQNEGAEYYYFYINAKSNDVEFSTDVVRMMTDYVIQKSKEISFMDFSLKVLPVLTYDNIEASGIGAQNDSRLRAFDYTDRMVRLNTLLENVKKLQKNAVKEETEAKPHLSGKKYAVIGFAGGAVLAVLFLILRILFSSKFNTEKDFRSWFTLNNLGTFPEKGESKGSKFRKAILRKMEGTAVKYSEDEFYRMTGTNMTNAAVGSKAVLVTGTVDSADMKGLEEQLMPMLKENSGQTEFVFAENLLGSPETRAHLQKTDSVVFVEKRNYSSVDDVKEEIGIVTALNKNVLGVVLL